MNELLEEAREKHEAEYRQLRNSLTAAMTINNDLICTIRDLWDDYKLKATTGARWPSPLIESRVLTVISEALLNRDSCTPDQNASTKTLGIVRSMLANMKSVSSDRNYRDAKEVLAWFDRCLDDVLGYVNALNQSSLAAVDAVDVPASSETQPLPDDDSRLTNT